jgi:tRNA A-37 threonylcarbamoyl transferase component Bud32
MGATEADHGGALTLHLPDRLGVAAEVSCGPALRIIAGKRSSHLARWNGRDVFVKLFFDKRRARVHWQREKAGIEALTDRSLLTPALLYTGWLPAHRAYVLITEALTDAQTLAEDWAQTPDMDRRLELLRRAATTLAQQHEAGVVQSDLHLGNFLVADGQVYSIDTSTIHARKGALSRQASLVNLGLLFAQVEPGFERQANDVLMAYALSRHWQVSDRDLRSLQAHIDEARAKRKQQFMKKIFRECSAFARRADRNTVFVYDKHYASDAFQNLYRNPDSVFAEAEGRYLKRGNTSTIVRTTVDGVDVAVKRYNIKGTWHGIRQSLRRTRASISWQNAHLLHFYGVCTARPIGFVEKRLGLTRRVSYFISEYVAGPSCREFFSGQHASDSEGRRLAEEITHVLSTLARYKLRHGDMKATNILIHDRRPCLVDLDAMREYKSETTFRHAHHRDVRRLLANWPADSNVRALFAEQLQRRGALRQTAKD